MKIYTKTGDKGTTSLVSGRRIAKTHQRIAAYGTVDELNAHLGMLRDQPINRSRQEELLRIQDRLFVMGSLLADDPKKPTAGLPQLAEADIEALEQAIDRMDEQLPPMRNFVLPGGHVSVSAGHIARVVCRRAERMCLILHEDTDMGQVSEVILKYLNRLSDYLFVLTRLMAQELHIEEVPWIPSKSQ
ncbi:MAG: cob(I)yrinic acid a,c-diamide adenosyltransferase [Bernardetiaceae bacterium]